MTIRQLDRQADRRLDEPASDGTLNQRLTLDNSLDPAWSGASSTIDAENVRIGGMNYTVQTGNTPAEGKLTIGTTQIWIGLKPVTLALGETGIAAIYKGTTQIYAKPTQSITLFDHGYVDGVSWDGNVLTRPQYTNYGYYSFDKVASYGYMRIYTTNASSSYNHNAHVITSSAVIVPPGAVNMKVSASKRLNMPSLYMVFGVLPSNAPDSYDTTNGGQLSVSYEVSSNEETIYSLPLDASVKGQSLYPIINGRGLANAVRDLLIYKVWFE